MGAQLDIALADCNKSLQIKDDDLAHMARGLVYLRTAKWDAANADYAAAIALAKRESDPPDPDALIGRALARLRKGEKAARPELAKLAKLYPTTYARFAAQGLLP
jgi:tetratricopeptide (TPR) repeat protein